MIKESMKNDPIDLPKNLIDIKDHEYVKVKVTGTFDHSKEQLIGPRAVKNANKYGGMISLQTSGNVGYHVVTPFLPNDRDYKILVNRGWIHQSKRYDQTRLKNQPKNEVTLVGFVRKTEEVKLLFIFKKKKKIKIFLNLKCFHFCFRGHCSVQNVNLIKEYGCIETLKKLHNQ